MTKRNYQRCRRCQGFNLPPDLDIHAHCDVDDRTMLLQLCASLTLCDHMGDVSDDVSRVLTWAGIEIDDTEDWIHAVRRALRGIGVTTIYGTSVGDEDP